MADRQITVQLQGSPEDQGHIRLSEFVSQLEAIRTALKNTERIIAGTDEASVYYRVVDLRHDSPATVVLEAVPMLDATAAYGSEVVREFITSLRVIRDDRRPPRNVDLQALQAYRDLATVSEKYISELKIRDTDNEVTIDSTFRVAVDELIGPDEIARGSISGMLEKINLHNTTRFDIFPTVGPKHVACDFAPELREDVIRALAKYVTVNGTLRYKRLGPFPYAINVLAIEIHPPDAELPSLFDIHGIAPDATGELSADEFVESIRNASNW